MDYEKKYKEALERASRLRVQNPFDTVSQMMEHVFPELAESKDERIRKGLLKMFNHYVRNNIELNEYDLDRDMVLAWLEKQGEQKSADKVKPKFHEGDWIAHNVAKFVFQIVGVGTYGYNVVNREGYAKTISLSNEENYHLWNISDAKDGDVLASKDELSILIFRNLDTSTSFSSYYNIQRKGELGWSNECFIPATKEQRDLLFQKMKEEGYEWDAEKKELKKIEQKSTDKDEPKEDNRPVTERIKTFDDARQELNTKAHSGDEMAELLLADYESNADNIENPQTLAYMRLAIIAYALNEGWEPQFEKGECRYFPWFYFYTKEQYDELDDEGKGRCVLLSGSSTNANNGFVFCNASYDASKSYSNNGSRLVFRTRELAEYAGKQFAEEWADFVFKTE